MLQAAQPHKRHFEHNSASAREAHSIFGANQNVQPRKNRVRGQAVGLPLEDGPLFSSCGQGRVIEPGTADHQEIPPILEELIEQLSKLQALFHCLGQKLQGLLGRLSKHRAGECGDPLFVGGSQEVMHLFSSQLVAAERQVEGQLAEPGHPDHGVSQVQIGGHVANRHRRGAAVGDLHRRLDQAGRGVQPDQRDRLADLDHPGLHQHGGGPDGAVPAHRQAAGDLDVQHADVGVRAGGRLQDRSGHRGMSTRFVHQQGAHVIGVVEEPLAPFEHGGAGHCPDAAGDHPGRHTLGVRFNRMQHATGAHLSNLAQTSGDSRFSGLADRGLLVWQQRLAWRSAAAALASDDVHRQLDGLYEFGLGVHPQ